MPRNPDRWSIDWTDWSGVYGRRNIRGEDPSTPSRESPVRFVVRAQKFVVVGRYSISRERLEDSDNAHMLIHKYLDVMKENLEGYLSVTSPVTSWALDFRIEQRLDMTTDAVTLRASGIGWFDSPDSGTVEQIDVSPQEDPDS